MIIEYILLVGAFLLAFYSLAVMFAAAGVLAHHEVSFEERIDTMAAIVQQPDLTEQELLTILENAKRILDGTHPLAGPEWTPVAIVIAQAAWRELSALREEKEHGNA